MNTGGALRLNQRKKQTNEGMQNKNEWKSPHTNIKSAIPFQLILNENILRILIATNIH